MECIDQPHLVSDDYFGTCSPKLDRNRSLASFLKNHRRGDTRQRSQLRIRCAEGLFVPPQQARRRSLNDVPVLIDKKYLITAVPLTGVRPHTLEQCNVRTFAPRSPAWVWIRRDENLQLLRPSRCWSQPECQLTFGVRRNIEDIYTREPLPLRRDLLDHCRPKIVGDRITHPHLHSSITEPCPMEVERSYPPVFNKPRIGGHQLR